MMLYGNYIRLLISTMKRYNEAVFVGDLEAIKKLKKRCTVLSDVLKSDGHCFKVKTFPYRDDYVFTSIRFDNLYGKSPQVFEELGFRVDDDPFVLEFDLSKIENSLNRLMRAIFGESAFFG